MRQLRIRNFEAVRNVQLDTDKSLNLVIGPQSSGKSTIAKVLYFCRKIRDFYTEYLSQTENFEQVHQNEDYISFLKYLRNRFISCFGTTLHMDSFEIEYCYHGEAEKVTIFLEDKYAKVRFSHSLREKIERSLAEAREIHERSGIRSGTFLEKKQFREELQLHFRDIGGREIFYDKDEIIYIPAGRSLLSIMSDQLSEIKGQNLDLPMQDFIVLIQETRRKFGTRMDRMVRDYVKTVHGQIKNADVDTAYDIIKKILKADYISDTDGEKLYYAKDKWVKLIYSSSGQQEALWILLVMFVKILENRQCFLVVEEPEAHLFPEAQMSMVEAISLFIRSTESTVFLTTHSPYILTSLNLLMHSALVEKQVKSAPETAVVPWRLRLSSDRVDTYLIETEGKKYLKNIKSEESGLINAMEIDRISDVINQKTELLFDMEYEQ